MPIWEIINDEKSEHVESDVIHHDSIGNLYFSIRTANEQEYVISQAFAKGKWNRLKLIDMAPRKTTKHN